MDPIIARLNAALVGRYVVLEQVGAGGMATVYVADDLRHDRQVALKVLKPELAAVVGADRFLTEIKVTAGLQHPNILPLFDSGEADSFLFYVMPFVEGESLRDRLDRERQLSVDEALRITISVANALDHAHRRGVVHRDIKPANIMLQDGEPVVADFGIALAVNAGQGRMTETGLSIGTPFYMSPEQATGEGQIAPPSDIYSLACVLFELLAGEPPHGGGTAQAILGRIISGATVRVREQRATVPEHVDAALRKALERIPADRFATAGAFARALADEGFRYGERPGGLEMRSAAGISRGAGLGLAGVTVVALLLAGWALTRSPSTPPARALASELTLGPGAPDRSIIRAVVSDGGLVVYNVIGPQGEYSLFARRPDEVTARPVPGTEGAWYFAVSPDGDEVAFTGVGFGPLRVTSLSDGGSRVLAEGAHAVPVWGRDHLYFTDAEFAISRVALPGGPSERITSVPEANVFLYPNDVLADTDALLYTQRRRGSGGSLEIHALSTVSGETSLVTEGANARYVDGLLVYASPAGDQVMGAVFDPASLRLGGPPVVLASGLAPSPSGASATARTFSLGVSGDLVYAPAAGTGLRRTTPVQVDRSGATRPIDPDWVVSPVSSVSGLDLSHDGTRLAVAAEADDGSIDIWVKNLSGGPAQRMTFDSPTNTRPFWGPDDGEIFYFRDSSGAYVEGDLMAVPSDGSGRPREVLTGVGVGSGSWVGDQWMIFRVGVPARTSRDIYGLPAGESEPVELVATSATEQAPSLSPDGRWLLYQSDRSGEHNVYVRPFPGVDEGLVQISLDVGTEPRWAHSGNEIFYRDGEGRMVSATVEAGAALRATGRTPLFDATPYWSDPAAQQYAVAGDDRSFIMLEREPDRSSFIVVWNWLASARARLDG